MITHSETIAKVTAALVGVQSDVESVEKTSTNPHFGNNYADLNAFLHVLRIPLAAHGLMMMQGPGMEDGRVVLDTLLVHESGEWIRNRAAAPMQKNDPQGVGSAITYLRRYSLAALFAIPQEDDDGNAASGSQAQSKQQRASTSNGTPAEGAFACPECGGPVWDNRADEQSSINGGKRPDWKCKDKACDTAVWVGRDAKALAHDAEQARLRDVITQAEFQRATEAAESGHPDTIRIARDWLGGKMEAANEAAKEAVTV